MSQTGQPFSYANNNPVNGSDPSGLRPAGPGVMCAMQRGSVLQSVCDSAPSAYAASFEKSPWWLDVAVPVGLAAGIIGAGWAADLGASCLGLGGAASTTEAGNLIETSDGQALEVTSYAAGKIVERGISLSEVSDAVQNGAEFSYNQEGRSQTGYYNPLSNTFVATYENRVINAFNPTKPSNYLRNLISK